MREVGNVLKVTFAQTPEVVLPEPASTVEPCPVTSGWTPGSQCPG